MNGESSALVVGGGIVGIACAHYLTEAGLRVTVLDRGRLAGACSHANCGFVCPSHVLPLTEPGAVGTALRSLFRPDAPFRVRPQWRPRLWRWMWQFARRCRPVPMLRAGRAIKALLDSSMAEYLKLVSPGPLECQWQRRGLLYVLRSGEGMRHFAGTVDLVRSEFGVPARRIEGRDLPDLEPALRPDLAGAFHYEGDAHLRPDLLNRNWILHLASRGVSFEEGCRVERFVLRNRRVVSLHTSKGERVADHYVLAAGAMSSLLERELGLPIPVEPGKGYSITMNRPELCPRHPLLFPEHRVAVTPFRDGYRIGSMMEFAGFDDSIPPARIRQLQVGTEPYLRKPCTEPILERWFGWRPMTWDSIPIIGGVPGILNAHLVTGHNMLGLSMAPGSGRLLSELLRQVPPHIDPAPYSPTRFG